MKHREGLSVVIPNYNNEAYLEACVQSVLEQTLQVEEILIVDDCSTDGSRKLIDRLARENSVIHPIYQQKNGGVSHARNIGIASAKGDYITCVDADDFYVNPDKLKNEWTLIQKYQEQGKNIVAYSKTAFVNYEAGRWQVKYPTYKASCYLQGNVFVRFLAGYQFKTSPRDYIVKKDIVLACGGYDEAMSLYEDTDLLMRLSQKRLFYCTGEFGTGYRLKETGLSRKPKKIHQKVWKKMFHNYYDILPPKEKLEVTAIKLYADLLHIPVEIRNVLYHWKCRILKVGKKNEED